jgi:hypothetical protein
MSGIREEGRRGEGVVERVFINELY